MDVALNEPQRKFSQLSLESNVAQINGWTENLRIKISSPPNLPHTLLLF